MRRTPYTHIFIIIFLLYCICINQRTETTIGIIKQMKERRKKNIKKIKLNKFSV